MIITNILGFIKIKVNKSIFDNDKDMDWKILIMVINKLSMKGNNKDSIDKGKIIKLINGTKNKL